MTFATSTRSKLARVPGNGQAEPWTQALPLPEHKPQSPVFPASLSDTAEAARLSLLPDEEQFLDAALSILTIRERQVVLAICSGGTNDAIAERLCIALPTLRTHLMRLNQKLRTTSKGDVVRCAATILIEGYRRGGLGAMLKG